MSFDLSRLQHVMLCADGAWSTELFARGYRGPVAELANLDAPELVNQLAEAYLQAGAQILTTNTFSANRAMMSRREVSGGPLEITRAGAEIAVEAASDEAAAVLGVIGPTGAIFAMSEMSDDEAVDIFAETAQALARMGVHGILLETFTEIKEAQLAIRAAKQATDLPVVASMSFDSGPQRTHTMMGEEAGECAAALEDAGADVIGCNCGAGPAAMLPVVVALEGHTELPLWVKPNVGLPELVDGRAVYRQPVEDFAAHVPKLLDAGANILGGCCGATPAHIRRIAQLIEQKKRLAK